MLVKFSNKLFSSYAGIVKNKICQRHGFHACCILLKQPVVSQPKVLKTTQVVVKKKTEVPIQALINWHRTNLKLYGPVIKESKSKKNAKNSISKPPSKREKNKVLKKEETTLPTNNEFSETNTENGEVVPALSPKNKIPETLLEKQKKENLRKEKVFPISDENFSTSFEINDVHQVKINQHKPADVPENSLRVPKKRILKTKETLLCSKKTLECNVGIGEAVPLPLQPSVVKNNSHLFPSNFTEPFIEKNKILLPFPMVVNKQPVTQSFSEIYSIPNSYPRNLPSVTSILNVTLPESSTIALATWRKRKIAEVGEEGFELFMREAKKKGKDFHTSIETHLRGVDYSSVHIEPQIAGYWLSLKSALESIKDVVLLESFVVHPQLQYKGCVDCVAHLKGTLVLIDWKTSDRRKNTLKATYDDPVQIAAYMGALNADSNYPFEVKDAVLVVAYPTGLPADVLVLKQELCEHYWQIWLQRLQLYNSMKRS